MNKTAIIFIVIIVLGLGAAFYVSSQKKQDNTLSALEKINPTPTGINLIFRNSTQSAQSIQSEAQPTIIPVSAQTALIKTEKGEIKIQLYPQDAPKTVTNFATLASYKFYDGLTFHRVEPGFVIQGGDPSGNGTGGASIYGATFEDELNPETESYKEGYTEGVVAMANRGPNTNSSQFFIMWQDKPELPRNYTIFGKVTEGMEVVRSMVAGDQITSITVE